MHVVLVAAGRGAYVLTSVPFFFIGDFTDEYHDCRYALVLLVVNPLPNPTSNSMSWLLSFFL